MHDPHYLRRARELCTRHGVHLIADEIAVGFGRTGTLFACEQAGIAPDLMCVSKGLTGGFLPLAAVLAPQHIYEAFLDDSRERAFLHSHSYTGNPLACAAARMAALAAPFAEHPNVAEVRQTGMILALELVADTNTRAPLPSTQRAGLRAYRHAIERGVLLRPLGDVLYWMPPYCIDEDGLDLLAEVTRSALGAAVEGL
jgi:adenosylmethionine-8-amino-7-oxononanoate aminotransferase